MQYGHLGQVAGGNQARDGDGFIPSANGSSAGSLFYFAIPHNPGFQNEKELRIVCFDNSTVTLFGATPSSTGWTELSTSTVSAGGHLDFVGATHTGFRTNDVYKLVVSPAHHRCTAYEANWMETGAFGTSDDASVVSSSSGYSVGNQFVVYVGPPGIQNNTVNPTNEATNMVSPSGGYASHLYVSAAQDNTGVTVSDVDTNGMVVNYTFTVNKDSYFDYVIDTNAYNALRASGRRPYLRIASDKPVTVTSGNYNDNWLLFASAARPAAPHAVAQLSNELATCGQTLTLTARCENVGQAGLDSAALTVRAPSGLTLGTPQFVSGSATAVVAAASGAALDINATQLSSGAAIVVEIPVTATCSDGCFNNVSASVQVECSGSIGGEVLADNASQSVHVTASTAVITSLTVQDFPGYDGGTPHTAVAFTVSNSTTGSNYYLYRAVNSGDPSAFSQVAQWQGSKTASESFAYDDNYSPHYEEARFYKVVATTGGCTSSYGPTSVRTSSGSSGGNESGLESNGRMAGLLARRALAGIERPNWVPSDMRVSNSQKAVMALFADQLSAAMLPEIGPLQSYPVNVTPPDLVGVTNAASVFAADYLTAPGRRVGSILIVQTQGEYYEHNKALCDRAGGSEIANVELLAEPHGSVLRMALRNDRERTGEYANEFKIIEDGNDVRVISRWHAMEMPELSPTARVYNIQVWSALPGIETSFADQLLEKWGLEFSEDAAIPATIFKKGAALSGDIAVELASFGAVAGPLTLRTYRKVGTRIEQDERLLTDRTQLRMRAEPFDEATLELLEGAPGAYRTLDKLWLSDGAWTWIDDTMASGHSTIHEKDFTACNTTPASTLQTVEGGAADVLAQRDELRLSGCAEVRATVDRSVGVARHFGGAATGLDLSDYHAVSFTLKASAPVQVCHETSAGPRCVLVAAQPTATRVMIPLAAFTSLDDTTCSSASLRGVRALTINTFEAGTQSLTVADVRYGKTLTDGLEVATECAVNVGTASAGGCRSTPGSAGTLLLALLGLLHLAPRRRHR